MNVMPQGRSQTSYFVNFLMRMLVDVHSVQFVELLNCGNSCMNVNVCLYNGVGWLVIMCCFGILGLMV
jgi:hypothetical protein